MKHATMIKDHAEKQHFLLDWQVAALTQDNGDFSTLR